MSLPPPIVICLFLAAMLMFLIAVPPRISVTSIVVGLGLLLYINHTHVGLTEEEAMSAKGYKLVITKESGTELDVGPHIDGYTKKEAQRKASFLVTTEGITEVEILQPILKVHRAK